MGGGYAQQRYLGTNTNTKGAYIVLSLGRHTSLGVIQGSWFFGSVYLSRGSQWAWNIKSEIRVQCGGQYTTNEGDYQVLGSNIIIDGLYLISYDDHYYIALKVSPTSDYKVYTQGLWEGLEPFLIPDSDLAQEIETISDIPSIFYGLRIDGPNGPSMCVLPNGRVKVGTTSLSTYNPQFDVLYDSTTNEGRVGIMCRTDQNEAMYGCFIPSRGWKFGVKNNDFIFWNGGGGDVAKITEAAGNLLLKGSTGSLSDIRVKSDIEPLQNRGFLQPKTYIKDGEPQIGFIAQEVKELYPELVLEDSNGYLSLSYGNITAVLQAQIIELKSIIDKQQECIDTLKNEINLLKEKWE